MKRGAYLVNPALGPHLGRDAMCAAWRAGSWPATACDSWYLQPAPADHPWRTMPHHGMTPHISGSCCPLQARYAAGTREILESYFTGKPISTSTSSLTAAVGRHWAHSYSHLVVSFRSVIHKGPARWITDLPRSAMPYQPVR